MEQTEMPFPGATQEKTQKRLLPKRRDEFHFTEQERTADKIRHKGEMFVDEVNLWYAIAVMGVVVYLFMLLMVYAPEIRNVMIDYPGFFFGAVLVGLGSLGFLTVLIYRAFPSREQRLWTYTKGKLSTMKSQANSIIKDDVHDVMRSIGMVGTWNDTPATKVPKK